MISVFLLKYSNIKNFIYLYSFRALTEKIGKNPLKKPKKGDGCNGY